MLVLLALPLGAARPYRVVAFGDSHTVVEAGMGGALTSSFGCPVEYVPIGINGTTANDLLRGFAHKGPFCGSLLRVAGLAPDLVVVAFGTNESVGRLSGGYELVYARLLAEVCLEFPRARVVALGPPSGDIRKVASLNQVRITQARVSRNLGVPWVDRAAIGGARQPDGVHHTMGSYRHLASEVAKQLSALVL